MSGDSNTTQITLNSKTIVGIIRRLLAKCRRDEIKQLLLEAGANSERVLGIPVSGNINAPDYKSKSDILNEGFDTIYQDFDQPEADGILLELVRLLFDRNLVRGDDVRELENALSASGVALQEVLEAGDEAQVVRAAIDSTESANLKEASDLLKKALLRLSTDPAGAITAAVSAAESVCREALSRLGIPEPGAKQLPDYLGALREHSNLSDLASVADKGDRAIKALASLAHNSYEAAHEAGDRHAHGDDAGPPPPIVTDMLVASACAITVVLAGALRRGELKVKVSL